MMDKDVQEGVNKRATKLRRSCEACRCSKGRCLPSEDASRCQKCLKEGKSCVFLEAKPRPKRAKNSRIRVAEMEEKLEGLLNLLAAQTGASLTPPLDKSSISNSTSTNSASTPESTRDQIDLPLLDFETGTGTNTSFPNSFFPSMIANQNQSPGEGIVDSFSLVPAGHLDKVQDVISKGMVGYRDAEDALCQFRASCGSFPFVVVPESMSIDTLRRHRPFLLLSILCYGSSSESKLQQNLEREMREMLSRMLIINGERNLDLLEGLLVYIAWYHYYFNPDNQQIYQLCQMATSLTADLGIDKPVRRAGFNKGAHVPLTAFLPNVNLEDVEAKRTYLGCYYITSAACNALRKPTNMKYSTYMEECAQSLAQAGHAENDHLLPYVVALQRISDEVSDAFDYFAKLELPPIDAVRIGILTTSFEQQLNQVETAFTPKAWDNIQLTMQLHFTRIHLHEVSLHAARLPQEENLSPQLKSRSWYYSTARSESLIRCLQASKDYIDRFLALPAESLDRCILPDIFGIIYAVLVLGTFAVGIDTPTLDPAQLREMTNYTHYLNALITKTIIKTPLIGRCGANDYMFHLHTLLQQTRVWYAQIAADPSTMAIQFPDSLRPGFSFMDIINTIVTRCVDFAVATTIMDSPDEQQWTELLTEWSQSLEPTMSLGSLEQFQS